MLVELVEIHSDCALLWTSTTEIFSLLGEVSFAGGNAFVEVLLYDLFGESWPCGKITMVDCFFQVDDTRLKHVA
eukprot:10483995-Ditylum_brightwellii.AAC.1